MIDRSKFFNAMHRGLYESGMSVGQVEGFNTLLDEWDDHFSKDDLRWLAYILATTYHETERAIQPIREIGRGTGRAYGVPAGPLRRVYYGRGYVQLTWFENYQRAEERLKAALGISAPLIRNPDLLLTPGIAAPVLFLGMIEGWFTGKNLGNYFGAKTNNPVQARRIVNLLDQATLIAGYHKEFLEALS